MLWILDPAYKCLEVPREHPTAQIITQTASDLQKVIPYLGAREEHVQGFFLLPEHLGANGHASRARHSAFAPLF